MTEAERFQRTREVFARACDLPLAERDFVLDEACGDDSQLRRDVVALLKHDDSPRGFVDVAAEGRVAEALAVELVSEAGNRKGGEPGSLPEQIGRYRIQRVLGQGGMGLVYEAEQDSPRRRVALKVIRPAMASAQLLARFHREAEVLGQLQHPGIAHIYEAAIDTARAGGLPYFAMEFIDGLPITEHARRFDLTPRERLELVARLCDAVQYAHQKGVIHRDLKPGNILVVAQRTGIDATAGRSGSSVGIDEIGQPKILDFGVARVTDPDIQTATMQTDAGQLIGTLAYMSPEQITSSSRDLDTRCDVYAIGVVLFELLTGRLPLNLAGRPVPEAARIICNDEPQRVGAHVPALRGDVEWIVARAIEKDKNERYQSAGELAADIRRYLSDEPILVRPPTLVYQFRKFARRNRVLVTAAALCLLLLLGGITGTTTGLLSAKKANRQLAEAVNEAQWQRELADASAERARANERKMQRLAYSTAISAALANIESDPMEARRQLDLAPADLRGWEWDYLSHRVGQPAIVVQPPVSAAWAEDGTPVAAVVRDARVRLFDMRTGRVLSEFAHSGIDNRVYLSPDATLVFARTGQDEGGAFEAATGRRRYTVKGWPDAAYPLHLGRSSLFCLVGPDTRSLVFRDLESGRSRAVIERPHDLEGVHAGVMPGTIDIHTWEQQASFDTRRGTLTEDWHKVGRHMSFAVSDDGSLRAEWSSRPVASPLVVKSAASGKVLQEWQAHTGGTDLAVFSPSNRFLLTNGQDRQIRIWDLADGRQLAVAAVGICLRMDFSPDESFALAENDEGAFLLNWRRSPSPRVLDEHHSYVYRVCYSPDGTLLASAGWDQAVHVYDTADGRLIHRLSLPSHHIGGLAFSADGAYVIALPYTQRWSAGDLVLWDVETGRRMEPPLSDVDATEDGSPSPDALASMPRAQSESKIGPLWWRIARGGAKATRYDGGEHMATSHDGSMLAHAQFRGDLLILDRETLKTRLTLVGHEGVVRAVAFSPDDTLLASGGDDRTVRVWDVATGRLLATMPGHSQIIFTVAFSPDASRIASGGNDNVIRVWDTASFEQVMVLPGHDGYVHSLAFSPDGRQLASGSGDRTVRLWDAGPR